MHTEAPTCSYDVQISHQPARASTCQLRICAQHREFTVSIMALTERACTRTLKSDHRYRCLQFWHGKLCSHLRHHGPRRNTHLRTPSRTKPCYSRLENLHLQKKFKRPFSVRPSSPSLGPWCLDWLRSGGTAVCGKTAAQLAAYIYPKTLTKEVMCIA